VSSVLEPEVTELVDFGRYPIIRLIKRVFPDDIFAFQISFTSLENTFRLKF
jgi:hypothetical protein